MEDLGSYFFTIHQLFSVPSIRLETETTLGASWSWESSFESGAEGRRIRDLFSTITFEALDTLYISAAGQFLPSGGMVNTSSRRIARHGWSVCHGQADQFGYRCRSTWQQSMRRHQASKCVVRHRNYRSDSAVGRVQMHGWNHHHVHVSNHAAVA